MEKDFTEVSILFDLLESAPSEYSIIGYSRNVGKDGAEYLNFQLRKPPKK